VPAPRLLIVADPKTIPALAGGLRDGGKFDVTAVSLAEPGVAQAAAERADAVALFYGAPGAPLSGALHALAPKLRERGARVVAVLQREQAAQRDDCFRAGASDVLFMPMPKDQFVSRLAAAVALAFPPEGGAAAAVTVATRGAASRLDRATVSPVGVEAPSELPLKTGQTVRLSWAAFQSWGLVVRGGPSAQVRFAGLGPEEEAKVRDWVKSGAQQPAEVPPASEPASAMQQRAPPQPAPAQPVAGRTAPGAGPPPGFADRRPARPPSRPAPRPSGPGNAMPTTGSAPVARRVTAGPSASIAARPSQAENGAGGLAELFDGDGASPAAAAAVAPRPAAVPQGPPWPALVSAPLCKAAAIQLLTDETVGAGVPPGVAASARKITAMLSVGERAWIGRTADSHFADALAARIALDSATSEGTRLASAGSVPTVDPDAFAALTKVADEAAVRLQQEANAAIGKGELETLQLVTAASAALSRDLLNLKETADRLRGVGSAPRLGAGALDPDVILPGQQPRPRPLPVAQTSAPVRAELRDFRGLDQRPGRSKGVIALVIFVAAIAVAANAFYFGVPRFHEVAIESAGDGVQGIAVTGNSAVVTVAPEWLAAADANLPRLLRVLRAKQVSKALLMLANGTSAGIVDVASGKLAGRQARPK
jgi:CheY-like chemotaxis protein